MANAPDSLLAAPRRALIILLGSIGDVVRALPLLGRMRRAWPDTHIAWAVEPKAEPILRGHPWLDEILVYDRRRAPWSFLPFLLAVRRAQFDLVLDLQRHLKSGLTAFVSGAKRIVGFAPENVKEFNHRFSTEQIPPQPTLRSKLLQYQAFGDWLELPSSSIEFALKPASRPESFKSMFGSIGRPVVGVILGSSWPSRIYFPEALATVIRLLHGPDDDTGAVFFPVLIGGPDESLIAAEVQQHLEGIPVLDLTGKTALNDLPALFAECDVAVGPDSGPMHIAAAVGCPVVSLWGSTSAERSAPWGFAEFALTAPIKCSPCYLRKCPIDRECMRRISPAVVARTVRKAHATRVRGPQRNKCQTVVSP